MYPKWFNIWCRKSYLPLADRQLLWTLFGSLAMNCALLFVVVIDFLGLALESPDYTTRVLAYPIMLVHLCGVGGFVIGTVFTVELHYLKLLGICAASGGTALISALLRAVFYLSFVGYFPEDLLTN